MKAINGVTAHFLKAKGKCRTILLALTEMEDVHSGKNITANTLRIIQDYGFENNVGYFVLDSASLNDTAVDEPGGEFNFGATWHRLHALFHNFTLECIIS
jgi:hypothetical protein